MSSCLPYLFAKIFRNIRCNPVQKNKHDFGVNHCLLKCWLQDFETAAEQKDGQERVEERWHKDDVCLLFLLCLLSNESFSYFGTILLQAAYNNILFWHCINTATQRWTELGLRLGCNILLLHCRVTVQLHHF